MVSQTNEKALEARIEKTLTGTNQEQLKAEGWSVAEANMQYRSGHGYWLGDPRDFDPEFALDRKLFWEFLETTQPVELTKLKDRPDWKRLVLQRLDRKLKTEGIVKVLKTGLRIDDAHLTLLYPRPINQLNPEITERFELNRFSVTRQVHYSATAPLLSIDLVLFINGLAVSTIELKNPWTGQTTYHAMKQYREDRDPKETLLSFGRCLVHFAVDTAEVFMTTRLAKDKTYFLPFNKGNKHGKGNPPNPNGHKADYLWKEILSRESLSNIIQHFAKLTGEKDSDPIAKKTLFFPRFHQLEVVRNLLQHTSENGVGHRYLIQHSAGSGKSNSITWAAYQLIELYPQSDDTPGGKGVDHPLFDSVIVVTDRRLLDKQLRNNIKQFSEIKNIVAPAFTSQDLKQSLESGKKIIITTIQKFPFIVEGLENLSEKRFAVIIDEAHSSQGGTAADNLNRSLGESGDEDEVQDAILEVMAKRKMKGNASYFAFTATPKNATLEKFGQQTPEGKFVPFHLYSMKQAIEEGFILDVLANYTTYRNYYQIAKSIEENPLFKTTKAQKKLRAFVEGHKTTIAVKAEIMVSHFIEQIVVPKKLKGQAKGLVVTRNIETAVRYFFAIRDALKQANAPFQPLIAFSGKKTVDGIEYTEDIINGFAGKEIDEKFNSAPYRLLVVANKYLTGFDQPKLNVMYIDKKLQGVLAVQALSRLNRCSHSLNKRTEDMFVLDFFNDASDMKTAFDPYYTATSLSEATDVNVLHDLKEKLDEVGVYEWNEVEKYCELFFANVEADQLDPIVDICVARFDTELELEDDEKIDFKIKAKQFVKIYAQMACMLPFDNIEWEKLYWFLKFLIPDLKVKDKNQDLLDALLESVDLSTYGLARTKLKTAIKLDEA
ncbi:MAG: type I restriction endonuclease subunit R, partial [SAR324 cluster bacterium]|nr:type I restriction endonuclease subunit R [SAR324 cluster bacterium]